jgi:hypothetical protein
MSDLLSDNPDVMAALLAALCDPGRFTDRAPHEPMSWWQRRAVIEHAAPYILAAGRAKLAVIIPPDRFRSLADWFDADDEFKVAMLPGNFTGNRGHELQDDLRKFAALLSGEEGAGNG